MSNGITAALFMLYNRNLSQYFGETNITNCNNTRIYYVYKIAIRLNYIKYRINIRPSKL